MELSDTLVRAIANYLATKPYNEVAGLISEIRKESQRGAVSDGAPDLVSGKEGEEDS